MAKIIAVLTQKGGVGKTTTTYALAAVYRSKGYRVLAVDMDPQHTLSLGMGGEWEDRATIYHVLKNEVSARFAVQRTAVTDLIPSTTTLSGIELEFTGRDRQFLLKRALEPIEGNYDYILIDCPPGLGILSTNALVAANFVLIPTLSDLYSLQGLVELYETVTFVKGQDNPSLEIAGVLLARYNGRTKLARELLGTAQMVCENLNIHLFRTKIRSCVTLTEAQNMQCNLLEYSRYCNGALDYTALANEMISRGV